MNSAIAWTATEQVLKIWQSGGWVMLPLFCLAILLYAQAFQLVLYVRRATLGDADEVHWRDWVRTPENAKGAVRNIVEYTRADLFSTEQIRNRFNEIRLSIVDLLDRRTKFVGMLVAAAPLLGLLGTVLGMLQTFFGLSTSGGAETAGVVAAGISEALVTTQTGLIIALPGLFLVMLIERRKHKLLAQLAHLECLTLGFANPART